MAGLKLSAFGGSVPRVAAHLLNDNESQRAINTKLYSGSLRPWYAPLGLGVLVPFETKAIYKVKLTNDSDLWFSWLNEVDVVKSPLQDASNSYSIIYSGDGAPKKTNESLSGATVSGESPDDWLYLGVPAPTTKPTVARVGSGGSPETRIYVYTYISEFGDVVEEGAPSPVSDEVLCGSGDTVTVNGFATAPTTGYNITKRRIYRSVAGTGATAFQFVTEIPLATTSFSDNVPSAGLGETLSSEFYYEPPSDLLGIVVHPSGFLIGFTDTDLWFSEVNRPHAWPPTYTLKLNDPIVGLGVFGQSTAVMTKGNPYVVSGVSPESMSAERVPMIEPCISKRSITADMSGVSYASPNGMVMLGPGVSGVTTGNVMLRDEFAVFHPETMRSAFYAGKYIGFFTGTAYGIDNGAIILDRNTPTTPLTLTNVSSSATFVDPETANLYLIIDNQIHQWEGYTLQTMPYEWKSKLFLFQAPANMGAIEINADFFNEEDLERLEELEAAIRQSNVDLFVANADLKGSVDSNLVNEREINGSILQTVPDLTGSRYILVSLYCDGKLIYTGQYIENGVYRLPSGFKGQDFAVVVAGNIELRYVKMAETVKELKTL